MENTCEPWLSCDFLFLDTDPRCTSLSAVVLLFLFLSYLLLKPFLPTLWKNEDTQEHEGRTKKRRRSRRFKGWRTSQKEQEEERRLFSILKSPLGQHRDATHFRQLLCPDPLCDVCNTTAAEVSRMLFRASLEDAAHTMSHLPSVNSVMKSSSTQTHAISAVPPGHPIPASLTDPFLSLPSVLQEENQATSAADSPSPSQLGDSLPLEPDLPLDAKSPVGRSTLEPILSPLPPPHHTQEAEPLLQREATLSPGDSSGNLSAYTLSSALPSFSGHSTVLRFLGPDSQVPLEREIKKTNDLLMGKEKEKETESFTKQHEPDNLLHPSGKRSEPAAHPQHPALSLSFWSSKAKPKELHMNQKPAGPKTLEDHLEQKCSQSCQLPGLPSESPNPLVPTSGDCFSVISNIFKARESPDLLHTSLLSLPEIQPQPWSHTLPQSLPQHLRLLTEAPGQLQSPPPILPDSPLDQVRNCGICFHSTQSEVQSLTLPEIHNLEYDVLPKVQENMLDLPSVVQKAQEDIGPPAPKLSLVTQSSKTDVPVSILPKDSTFKGELRKKLEHHLQRRLIHHQWALRPRVLKSPSVVHPQRQAPENTCISTFQGISFLSSSKQMMLEEHIKTFHSRTMWGLPHKVQRSIEIFNQKQHPYQVSSHSKFLSSNMSVSRADSKIGVSKSLRRNSNTSSDDKVGTTNSAVGLPYPATSYAGMEGQGTLRQAPSYANYEPTKNMQTGEDDTQTCLLHTHSNTGSVGQKQTLQTKRHSQKPTTRLTGAGPEERTKRTTSSNDTERLHSKMTAKLDHFPKHNKSREILKGKELCTLQPQSGNILMPSELEGILGRDVNMSKPETTPTDGKTPTRLAVPQNLKSSDSKNQLLNESMFEMESREQSQSQGLPTDVPLASNNLKTSTLLSHDQDASCVDMVASQAIDVPMDKAKNIMEQGREPWVPTNALYKSMDKNFPAAGRVYPPAVKAGKHYRGHAGLGTHHTQDRPLEGTLGGKTSPAMPLKGQPPSQSLFSNNMKHFFQWLCPSTRSKGKESLYAKAGFTRNTIDQNFSTDSPMVPEEKPQLTCRVNVAVTSSHFHPSRSLEKNSPKQGAQVQAESVQEHHLSYNPSCSTMTNVKSYSKGLGLLGQRYYARDRPNKAWGKQPPKDIPHDDQKKHHLATLHREPVPRPRPSCGTQVDQVPLAGCIRCKGVESESFSLLLKEKILLQHFEARPFSNLSPTKTID